RRARPARSPRTVVVRGPRPAPARWRPGSRRRRPAPRAGCAYRERSLGHPHVRVSFVNFAQYGGDVVFRLPLWIVGLEPRHTADPPLVVPDPGLIDVVDLCFPAGDLFRESERLDVGGVGEPAPTQVVDLGRAGVAEERLKRGEDVVGVDGVPDHLA